MTANDADSARDVIILRRLDENETEQLDGTVGTGEMFFSPDGSSIAFFADGKLKRASVNGGSVVTLADAPTPAAGSGFPTAPSSFRRSTPPVYGGLPRAGGAPEVVLAVDPERDERTFRFPHATPDGEIVLFTVGALDSPNNYNDAAIDVFSLETGERRTAIEHASMARFASRDRIVFARSGDLYAIDFDPDRLKRWARRCRSSRMSEATPRAAPGISRSRPTALLLGWRVR